ncbi:MAG: DUF3021 family protein [Lactobacillaceae bacterium]
MVSGFDNFIFAIMYLQKTVVKFIVNYIGFTPLAILAGWGPYDWVTLLVFTGELVMIYLVFLIFST